MADQSSYRITIRIEGKEKKAFDLGEKTLRLPADENVVYQIEEVGSPSLPDNIVLSRVGNDLWVMPEGQDKPQAIIEGYFSTKNASFGAFGVDGSLYNYGIDSLKTVNTPKIATNKPHDVAEEVTPIESAESSSGLNIPVISTAAIALGGIVAVAASGRSSSSKSDDHATNHHANSTTTSHAKTASPLGAIASPDQGIDKPNIKDSHFVDVMSNEFPYAVKISPDANSDTELSVLKNQPLLTHTLVQPIFDTHTVPLIKGQARAGDIITTITSDADHHEQITYYLQGSSRDLYNIDHSTGLITLTKVGANWVNAGHDLPDIEVIAYDEQLSSIKGIFSLTNTSAVSPSLENEHSSDLTANHNNSDNSIETQVPELLTATLNAEQTSFIDLLESGHSGSPQWEGYGNDTTNLTALTHYAHSHSIKHSPTVNFDNDFSINTKNHHFSLHDGKLKELFDFNLSEENIIQLKDNLFTNLELGKVKMEYSISGETTVKDNTYDYLIYSNPYSDTDENAVYSIEITQFANHFSEVTSSQLTII